MTEQDSARIAMAELQGVISELITPPLNKHATFKIFLSEAQKVLALLRAIAETENGADTGR